MRLSNRKAQAFTGFLSSRSLGLRFNGEDMRLITKYLASILGSDYP
jgi:hypothetical protein